MYLVQIWSYVVHSVKHLVGRSFRLSVYWQICVHCFLTTVDRISFNFLDSEIFSLDLNKQHFALQNHKITTICPFLAYWMARFIDRRCLFSSLLCKCPCSVVADKVSVSSEPLFRKMMLVMQSKTSEFKFTRTVNTSEQQPHTHPCPTKNLERNQSLSHIKLWT